jgi:hypothetical protein
MTKAERRQATERFRSMMMEAGIEATHRITKDGVEFGFRSEDDADALRLNMMAMEGDFGPHTHTEEFDDAALRDRWIALSHAVATGLGTKGEYDIDGLNVVAQFENSADALIFRRAMKVAMEKGTEAAIEGGLQAQNRFLDLRDSFKAGPSF